MRTKQSPRRKELHSYILDQPRHFLTSMIRHTKLYAKIPWDKYERPMNVAFGLKGGEEAIQEAMSACNMKRSRLRDHLDNLARQEQ